MAKAQAGSAHDDPGEINIEAKIAQIQELTRTLDINKPINVEEGEITPFKLATTLSIDEMVELLLGSRGHENNELITHAVAARDGLHKITGLMLKVKANDYSRAPDDVERIVNIVN